MIEAFIQDTHLVAIHSPCVAEVRYRADGTIGIHQPIPAAPEPEPRDHNADGNTISRDFTV